MSNQVIQVNNVSKAVGIRQLLSDVSFVINEAELVSLIGPNGAGKSTLVKIILGLDKDYTGTVHISNKKNVRYIPQLANTDQHQLPISVEEYLKVGLTSLYRGSKKPVDLNASLTHVGVSPDILNQPFSSLSGGERQRVAIARALLSEPTILVLDEPLASVDYGSRQGLYELIRHLQQDHRITTLLVSHDIESVLPLSDRVLCLNKTLRTDCHPQNFKAEEALPGGIHHHC